MDLLMAAKQLVSELEFASYVRRQLVSVRLVHESDRDTFDRVMRLARDGICGECHGYGQRMYGGHCDACGGSGRRANQPEAPRG